MKKNERKSLQGWVNEYRAYFSPSFVEVKGRIFRTARSERARRAVRDDYAEQEPTATDENTDNHEHFWIFDNATLDGCRKNCVLAEAVRLAWDEILKRQFPKLKYRLFVSNEYMIETENDSSELTATVVGQQVLPTLRLWTHTPSNIQGFDELYRLGARGPDSAWWYNSWQFGIEARPFPIAHLFEVMTAAEQSAMTVQQLHEALSRGCDLTTA